MRPPFASNINSGDGHNISYSFHDESYQSYQINGKAPPSFLFCSGKKLGGIQGGNGTKQWRQGQVGSDSVGKILLFNRNLPVIRAKAKSCV